MKNLDLKKLATCCMTLCMVFFAIDASALTQRKNGITWTYDIYSGGSYITRCPTSASGAVVVPDRLGGFPVVGISGNSYRSYGRNYVGVFKDCTKITSITFPKTLVGVTEYSFKNCSRLKKIVFLSKVTWWGDRNPSDVTVFANIPNSCIVYVPTKMGWEKDEDGYGYAIPGYIGGLRLRYISTYNVQYVANGGTGKMATQTFKYNKTYSLAKNTFKKAGYKFYGWSKSKKGNPDYKDRQKIKGIGSTGGILKLYAVWAKPTYKVAFKANGGNGKMAKQTMVFNKGTKLRKNAFKRSGYTFLGWSLTSKGLPSYFDGQTVKNLLRNGKTLTLYAVWQKNALVVDGFSFTPDKTWKYGRWSIITYRGHRALMCESFIPKNSTFGDGDAVGRITTSLKDGKDGIDFSKGKFSFKYVVDGGDCQGEFIAKKFSNSNGIFFPQDVNEPREHSWIPEEDYDYDKEYIGGHYESQQVWVEGRYETEWVEKWIDDPSGGYWGGGYEQVWKDGHYELNDVWVDGRYDYKSSGNQNFTWKLFDFRYTRTYSQVPKAATFIIYDFKWGLR